MDVISAILAYKSLKLYNNNNWNDLIFYTKHRGIKSYTYKVLNLDFLDR